MQRLINQLARINSFNYNYILAVLFTKYKILHKTVLKFTYLTGNITNTFPIFVLIINSENER